MYSAEHRFTNLLMTDWLFHLQFAKWRCSTLIAKGPFSPQGNCHDSKRVKASEGRRPQADSSTSRPEFIGVSGIYATTDKYTKRLPFELNPKSWTV